MILCIFRCFRLVFPAWLKIDLNIDRINNFTHAENSQYAEKGRCLSQI